MTRPLLLLALAAVLGFLYGLRRGSVEAPREGHAETPDPSDCPGCGGWRDAPDADCGVCGFAPPESGDGIAPPDPWTTGLLGLDRVIAEDRDRRDWRNATKSYARDAGWTP